MFKIAAVAQLSVLDWFSSLREIPALVYAVGFQLVVLVRNWSF